MVRFINMTTQNPMSSPDPWNMVAEGYVTDTRPIFEQYCHKAIELSGLEAGDKVLDVACGPGTMSLLLKDIASDIQAIDFSRSMLDCFDREIERLRIANIKTHLMDGQNLEFGDSGFDRVFSIFGLMFFPDRMKGFRELHRVLRPGGVATVTSWAPVSESAGMSLVFGAMHEAFPRKPESNSKATLNLEDPEHFRKEMSDAGFRDVAVTDFDGYWQVNNVEEFFDSIVRGSAPIVMIKNRLSEPEWTEKRNVMLDYMKSRLTELPASLNSRAYIATGIK